MVPVKNWKNYTKSTGSSTYAQIAAKQQKHT